MISEWVFSHRLGTDDQILGVSLCYIHLYTRCMEDVGATTHYTVLVPMCSECINNYIVTISSSNNLRKERLRNNIFIETPRFESVKTNRENSNG